MVKNQYIIITELSGESIGKRYILAVEAWPEDNAIQSMLNVVDACVEEFNIQFGIKVSKKELSFICITKIN